MCNFAHMKAAMLWAAAILALSACTGAAADSTTTTSTPVTTTTTSTTTTTIAPTTTTTVVTTTATTAPAPPAITSDGGEYTITWTSLSSTPFYSPPAEGSSDPFFHIHTNPSVDGFFLSFEMYTTGYGALWTGEPGDVEILCYEPVPGPNSTGICPHFVPPDGAADLNADFMATGSITINQLDENGYDIVVNELVFTDGSYIVGLHMTGGTSG